MISLCQQSVVNSCPNLVIHQRIQVTGMLAAKHLMAGGCARSWMRSRKAGAKNMLVNTCYRVGMADRQNIAFLQKLTLGSKQFLQHLLIALTRGYEDCALCRFE